MGWMDEDLASKDAAGRMSGEATRERILKMLVARYKRPIMNNTQRGDYVECMIALALSPEWKLTWEDDWDWAAWDCEHRDSKARLEIKQSAARQPWDGKAERPRRDPRFDIAPRTGYWPRDGRAWIADPGRPADLYVFAWHGEVDKRADHRDVARWRFFVVAERRLPVGQKSIGLGGLEKITVPCTATELGRAVEEACPPREELKAFRRSIGVGQ